MNKEDKKDLPLGWVWTKLKNVAQLEYGKALKREIRSSNGTIPVYGSNGIVGYHDSSVVEEPTIIVGRKGAAGEVHLSETPCWPIDTTYYIKESKYYDLKLFYHLLKTLNLRALDRSTAIPGLNREDAYALPIPLPPLPEQQRIADKIEKLFTRSKKIKTNLDQVPKQLERLRKSILAAAVRNDGELETTKSVCEEIQIGPFGTQLHKHDYISNGIPLINPTHIQKGQIIPDLDLTISKTKFEELPNYHLKTNDTIMGRRGEMARCALVSEKENSWLCGTGSLFFRPNLKKINPQYLYWVLSNSNTKAFLEQEANGSTMSNLNLNIARNIPIPLPPLAEQKEIVRRVEKLLANVDKLEAAYKQYSQKLNTLNQSILAKAFRGALVPQDPKDEPASVLLEKIKAGGSV